MAKHIEVDRQGDITIVTVTDSKLNEYDQSHELRDEIVHTLKSAEVPKVVIDMGRVEYLTSVVLLPFVSVSTAVEELGGHVVLCNLADVVAKVLTVSQLLVEKRTAAHHLQLASDMDSAIAILHEGESA